MSKLTLDPEALRVQTFEAAPQAREATAADHDRTRPHICDPVTAWC